ncbi:MAG: ATP-binding protein, partial [Gemmatimonadota bacterium]
RRLSAELERRAREELLRAPMVLEDRNAARAEALAMHADVVAAAPGLSAALLRADREAAISIATSATDFPGEEPVVVGPDGAVWVGPPDVAGLLDRGAANVAGTFVDGKGGPRAIALAPVPGAAPGAAGVAAPLDAASAATLAALTRSAVAVLTPGGGVAAATADSALAAGVARLASRWGADKVVHEVAVAGSARWIVVAPLAGAGNVAFIRTVDEELAAIPGIRRSALVAALVALALAVLVGSLVALLLARPVRALAGAAGKLAEGDFAAPLPRSAIVEVRRMAAAFDSMRAALAARLAELGTANSTLQDRQARLEALQTELIQQDRLAASGRLVAELAHEIRNPLANVRNCLEVVRRRLATDPEGRAFADMAVDELLRMHRLSEQLLDLHRPSENEEQTCDAAAVLEETAALARAGTGAGGTVLVETPAHLPVSIPRDALKQVLLNLVENAREAAGSTGTITLRATPADGLARLEVLDTGPGIPEGVLPRMFDPFFTTKGAVSGVGLGLFVAEGIARRYGGRLQAGNLRGGGARMVLELLLPAAVPS